MNVRFFYRTPDKLNRSIERVFESVELGLKKYHGIKARDVFAKALRPWPVGMLCNMLRMGFTGRGKGINHVTGDIHYVTLLMPRKRTVLTVHDLVSLHNPQVRPAVRRMVYYLWYYLPLRHLKYVTCISEATRRDLTEMFPFAASKITVIPNPIPDSFSPAPPAENPKPVVLHMGTRSNKNLERVIRALEPLDCHLRIIGRLSPEQEKLLADSGLEYSNACGISDKQVIEEYRRCDVVSFPSLFEGFGMPIIEGQACGRAVVTSDIEPMKSIAGGAAVLVDPQDTESIRRGFESLIKDPDLRRQLAAKGIRNAENYTIKSISSKYNNLYVSIL